MKKEDEDVEKVRNLWNMLWPVKKIAEELNYPTYKINQLINKARKRGYTVLSLEEKNRKRKELAVQMWNEGKSRKEIGDELFISSNKVSELLSIAKEEGSELRKAKEINMDIIVKMWNDGKSQEDIADKLDTNVATVFNYLLQAKNTGINLRDVPIVKEKKDRYKQYLELKSLGMDTKKIANQIGVSEKRIKIYMGKSDDEKQKSLLDKFLDMWDDECSPQEISEVISKDMKTSDAKKYDSKEKTIELLKEMLPQDVAERLNISIGEVYSIIYSLNEEELKKLKKDFLKSKKEIYSFIKKEKENGKTISQAFENYENQHIKIGFVDLSEIYLVLGLKSRSINILNKIIYNNNMEVYNRERAIIQKERIEKEITAQNMNKEDKDYTD